MMPVVLVSTFFAFTAARPNTKPTVIIKSKLVIETMQENVKSTSSPVSVFSLAATGKVPHTKARSAIKFSKSSNLLHGKRASKHRSEEQPSQKS